MEPATDYLLFSVDIGLSLGVTVRRILGMSYCVSSVEKEDLRT